MLIEKGILNQKEVFAQERDLVTAKLSAPILRSRLVHRERLTELLRHGMQQRLTLVEAPAGYGKTTLLGEWLSTITGANWPVAWVTLDAYDNDPMHFWSYIVAALRTIQPSLQFNVQGVFHGQCEPGDCTQLNPLINEVADIRRQFTLVLDDYHEIQDEHIHHSLAYFIDYLPGNCHLIISSRILPPLPISRLRARGQLVEITSSDLSFTLDETDLFLTQVMKLDIPWDQVKTLLDMTEGWIAGLQLTALSLQGRQDARRFISDITEMPRHILDYLTEEVLNRQDQQVKSFLLRTSVLERLSAPLCDAMLSERNSREMLETLEQLNLFITPLDEQRHWYRYHALFADLLRKHLDLSQPELAPKLHLAAYHWLKDNGYPEKAVMHAFAAGEDELAAETIESCALQAIIRMDLATVLRWFKLLPQVQIEKRLRLLVYYALVHLMLGKGEELENQLNSIEKSLADVREGEIPVDEVIRLQRYVNALRAAEVCMRGDFSLGIRSSQQVLENLLPEDYFFFGLVEHYMAFAYQSAGRLSEGAQALESACQNALSHNLHKEFVLSQSEKARFYRLQGRLNEAAQAYRLAVDYSNVHVVGEDIRICPRAGLAEVMREWNQIQSSTEQLSEPMSFLMHSPWKKLDWSYTIDVCLAIARNCILQGANETADEMIQMAQVLAGTLHFFPELYSVVNAARVELWLARGDFSSAVSWLNRQELQMQERLRTTPSPAVFSAEQIAMARIYLATDRPEKAEQILDTLLAIIGGGEQGDCLVKAYIVRALAQWHQGRRDEAAASLAQALALAESENMVRSFLDEGAPMLELLTAVLGTSKLKVEKTSAKNHGTFIEHLLRQAEESPKQNTVQAIPPRETQTVVFPRIEPLSQRELQILALISRGYSAGDTARELVISVNTAKAHIKRIYQKLDVHSRREAIEKAKELRLLAE